MPRLENGNSLVDWDERGLLVSDVEDEAVLESQTKKGHQVGGGHQHRQDLEVVEQHCEDKIKVTHVLQYFASITVF